MNKSIFLRLVLLFFIFLGAPLLARGEDDDDYSKGPLYGKDMYIPSLVHGSLPALPAKSGRQYDLQYHVSLYYVQDVKYFLDEEYPELPESRERHYEKNSIGIDAESCVVEGAVTYNILNNIQAGINLRFISFYGGILDPAIEGFHDFFGFENGGREYFSQNQIYVDIPYGNGVSLYLDKESAAFGDIDLWGKWSFFEDDIFSLAAVTMLKIPSGRIENLSGSGYFDAGFGILSDIRLFWFLTLYAQAGAVIPVNDKATMMFNGLAGVGINPWKIFSINVQMNFKTGHVTDAPPQTNILAGFTVKNKNFRWQFYFEEDAFTNQGADMTINFMFSHTLTLNIKS
ncbi:hypothetical protein AGMMS49928_20160 [Spirochaetia bacterium]|nr:hypothetical protein AGMMS49928_20160 [Spirochaetia bacterium]